MCVCLDSLVAVVLTICLDIKNTKKKKKETKQEEQEKKEQAKTGWLDQFLHPCHIFSTGETRYFSTEKCGYHPAQMIIYAIRYRYSSVYYMSKVLLPRIHKTYPKPRIVINKSR